jgi:hypothetical protein
MVEPVSDEVSPSADGYSLNFSKQEYENPSPVYWKVLESQALERNRKLYDKYLGILKYGPNQVLYEDEQMKVRKMDVKGKEGH